MLKILRCHAAGLALCQASSPAVSAPRMARIVTKALSLCRFEIQEAGTQGHSLLSGPLRRHMAQKAHPTSSWKSLSSKRGNKNYYKGRGAQHAGMHTSKGKYVVLPARKPNYIVPDMTHSTVRARTRSMWSRCVAHALSLHDLCVSAHSACMALRSTALHCIALHCVVHSALH